MCEYGKTIVLNVPSTVDIRSNTPEYQPKLKVTVDSCLAKEIEYLWSLGIRTTGCCCGHGKEGISYIGVEFLRTDGSLFRSEIDKMKDLGYKPRIHPDPEREDNFIPKSSSSWASIPSAS